MDPKNRSKLKDLRILKRELVYLIGLSEEIADEQKLREKRLLGQYGTIRKIIVNKDKPFNRSSLNGPSFSAYVTFSTEEEASLAILSVDGFEYDRRIIKASYGMTKYCSFFVKGLSCPNDDCLYLHKFACDGDCFNKEEGNPAKYVLKVGQYGIIEHIISKNKEFWKIGNKARIERDFNAMSLPGLSCAWRKIRSYCKEKGIAFGEKERTKVVKASTKTEKKAIPNIIKTSKWSHEEELPIFPKRNAFKDEEEEEEEEELVTVTLKKTTSVRQNYETKKKDIFISKSNIDFTKKDKTDMINRTAAEQVYTPRRKDKQIITGFGSPKSEYNNKTSIHAKDKTEKTNEANQKTLDTQLQPLSRTGETDIVSEIEQVLDKNSSEYTELDKKIFSLLGRSYYRLKKEESEIVKRGQSLSVNSRTEMRTRCTDIKKIIDNFLKPNEELLSAKSQEETEKPNNTHFRLFGQSYTIHMAKGNRLN